MKKSAIFPSLQLQEGPLNEQVYSVIRHLIIERTLKVGSKLPSSRDLSTMMAVSRNTIIQGIERLIDEGYLETKRGSGTYVTAKIPDKLIAQSMAITPQSTTTTPPKISHAIQALQPHWAQYHQHRLPGSIFRVGIGCTDLFPQKTWSRILGRVARNAPKEIRSYNDVMGYLPLREVLASYLATTRGVHTTPEQIMIVNGTQQAINLTCQVLLNPHDEVILDDPGYDGALCVFKNHQASINLLHSDDEGMDIPYAKQHYPNTQLIYTAPSHQFPLGEMMSLTRRLQLLEWAKSHDKWIFEDDYNGEFRYHSRAIQALQGLDQAERVIYSGTFSKMFYPGFRLGFIVLPKALIEPFKIAKFYADAGNTFLEQAVLAAFIQEGEYAKHVRRVRKACLERQQALIQSLTQYLPEIFTITPLDSGIHSIAWINDAEDFPPLLAACKALKLGAQPLDRYTVNPLVKKALIFGFAAHSPAIIRENIQALSQTYNTISRH